MKKTKILVVDDEPIIAEAVQALLEANDYAVVKAFDGVEAMQVARKELPDLILLDLMLPRLSGIDVCRLIKREPGLKNTPVIMLTALSKVADVEKAFLCGAIDYVIKPFDNIALLDKVQKHLK